MGMPLSVDLQSTIARLGDWFAEAPGVLVAFSGGVDSSLVAYLAKHFLGRERCLAVISASPSLKMSELDGARKFARNHAIPLEESRYEAVHDPRRHRYTWNRPWPSARYRGLHKKHKVPIDRMA